jgi:hypothetical protein
LKINFGSGVESEFSHDIAYNVQTG